jgi:hypothetical protein
MKTSPDLTLQHWIPWIPTFEHTPLTMELGLSSVCLVAILKGDSWRTRNSRFVTGIE